MKKLAAIVLSFGLVLGFASCKFAEDYTDAGLFTAANAIAPSVGNGEIVNAESSEVEQTGNSASSVAPEAVVPESGTEVAPEAGQEAAAESGNTAAPEADEEIVQEPEAEPEAEPQNGPRVTDLRAAPFTTSNYKVGLGIIKDGGAESWKGKDSFIGLFIPNWADVDDIKNISTIVWKQTSNGGWSKYWWHTNGIGKWSEYSKWFVPTNGQPNQNLTNLLVMPAWAAVGTAKYEITVNFKDGTSEFLTKTVEILPND